MLGDLARLVDDVLDASRGLGRPPDAPALTLLIRCYRATGRGDVRDALGRALGGVLAQPLAARPPLERAGLLAALVEALPVADDDRIRAAIEVLVDATAAGWGGATQVEESAASLDALLAAAAALDARSVIPGAIDELERVIGAAYAPGEGLAPELGVAGARGRLGDHVRCASALLTAHQVTARIPYGMLAEELMQFARRVLWDEGAAAFAARAGERDRPFALNCAAARVYCRLAALHATGAYREAAVVAEGADYRADAARILDALSERLPGSGFARADYGLALDEWLGGS